MVILSQYETAHVDGERAMFVPVWDGPCRRQKRGNRSMIILSQLRTTRTGKLALNRTTAHAQGETGPQPYDPLRGKLAHNRTTHAQGKTGPPPYDPLRGNKLAHNRTTHSGGTNWPTTVRPTRGQEKLAQGRSSQPASRENWPTTVRPTQGNWPSQGPPPLQQPAGHPASQRAGRQGSALQLCAVVVDA